MKKERKAKFLNKPEETTVRGTQRVKHRMFNKEELDYLMSKYQMLEAESKNWSIIAYNFNLKFKWRPAITSISSFYLKKTYKWAWTTSLDDIPENQKQRVRTNNRKNICEEYEDELRQVIQDKDFGSSYENFAEYMKVCMPQIKINPTMFYSLRKKYGGHFCKATKDEVNTICEFLKSSKKNPEENLLELQKTKEVTISQYNHFAKLAGTDNVSKRKFDQLILRNKINRVNITSFQVRYNIDGQFFTEDIDLPKELVSRIKEKIAKDI